MTLSERAWRHIRERHPEMEGYERPIRETLSKPEVLLRGSRGEGKAVRLWPGTHLGPKFIVVVFGEEGGKKDIITAYFTSDLKRIRGDVVWRA